MATPQSVLAEANPGDLVGVVVECPQHQCDWQERFASAEVVNQYGVKDPIPDRCPRHELRVEIVEIVKVIR